MTIPSIFTHIQGHYLCIFNDFGNHETKAYISNINNLNHLDQYIYHHKNFLCKFNYLLNDLNNFWIDDSNSEKEVILKIKHNSKIWSQIIPRIKDERIEIFVTNYNPELDRLLRL